MLCLWIKLFCHPVPRSTNLDRLANINLPLIGLRLSRRILRLASRSLRQVGLMPLPLRVRQVVPLVVVQRQAKLTLVTAEVVAHEVGVLGEIDGLEGEAAEALAAVDGFVLGGGGAPAPGLRTPLPIHSLAVVEPRTLFPTALSFSIPSPLSLSSRSQIQSPLSLSSPPAISGASFRAGETLILPKFG